MELLSAVIVFFLCPEIVFSLMKTRDDIVPLYYRVYFEPFFLSANRIQYGTFLGETLITLQFASDGATTLELDSRGLYCTKATVFEQDVNITTECACKDKADSIEVTFPDGFKTTSVYMVNVFYIGRMGLERGLKWDTFMTDGKEKRHILWTEIGELNARTLFPCVLDPKYRTPYEVVVATPPEYGTLSHEGIDHKYAIDDGYVMFFSETPSLPSYLLSVVFLKPTRSYSSQVDLALVKDVEPWLIRTASEVLRTALRAYKEEFDLDHRDLGIRKVFALGHYKMSRNTFFQSWGIGLFDEELFKFNPEKDTVMEEQLMLTKLTSAVASMWFAVATSPRTWADSWISKGLTKYYEYFGANAMYPHLATDIQFVVNEMHPVMLLEDLDMQLSFYDETYSWKDYSENIMNSWLHTKAAALFRMLNHAMTAEQFKIMMGYFIRTRLERTYTQKHIAEGLWVHAPPSTQMEVQNLFIDWVKGHSVPTIMVTLAEDGMSATLVRLNKAITKLPATSSNPTIPLTFVTSTNPRSKDTFPKEYMMNNEWVKTLDFNETMDWIILNNQRTGMYRSLYSKQDYKVLGEVLLADHTEIHQLNRAQLIDDLFFFYISELVSVDTLFRFLRYLPKERDYAPWKAAIDGLVRLSIYFESNELPYLEEYVWYVTENIYQRLGFIPRRGETVLDSHLRNLILNTNCRFHHANISLEAFHMLFDHLNEGKRKNIPNDVLTTVTCCGVRFMSNDLFDKVITSYKEKDTVKAKRRFFDGMACVTHPLNVETFVNLTVKYIPVKEREAMITRVIEENPNNAWFLYLLITKDFRKLLDMFQNIKSVVQVLRAISMPLNYFQFQHWQSYTDRYNKTLQKNDSTIKNAIYIRKYFTFWRVAQYNILVQYLKNKTYIPVTPPQPAVPKSNNKSTCNYAKELFVLLFVYASRLLY